MACGKTTQAPVPRAREGSGFMLLQEALGLTLCHGRPAGPAAWRLRLRERWLRRRIEHNVAFCRQWTSGRQTFGERWAARNRVNAKNAGWPAASLDSAAYRWLRTPERRLKRRSNPREATKPLPLIRSKSAPVGSLLAAALLAAVTHKPAATIMFTASTARIGCCIVASL